MTIQAAVRAVNYALPESRLTNEELSAVFGGWSAQKIEQKTGIRERRIASTGECSSDLAFRAAQGLFETGVCGAADVDFVLLCTQTPDYVLPTTACILQERLDVPRTAGALDFNLGCSGYVYGLGLAKGLVETGQARRVLLLTAETYSKLIHPLDRSVRTLFGDAGAATLIEAAPRESEEPLIGPFVYGTDGGGAANLIVRKSGFREPAGDDDGMAVEDGQGNWRAPNQLFMNGAEIFNFAIRTMPACVATLLERAHTTLSEMDLFVFHQANHYMLEHLRKKIGIPKDRFVVALSDTGNTVSATIPIALCEAAKAGQLRPGMRVALVGFGVGYSWAACLVRW